MAGPPHFGPGDHNMQDREESKPTGYNYPKPSIEGGKITSSTKPPPEPLSRESVEKLREAARRVSENR